MDRKETLEELDLDFSDNEQARATMKQYIRENFADVLGDRIELLEAPNGLELLRQEVESLKREAGLTSGDSQRVA